MKKNILLITILLLSQISFVFGSEIGYVDIAKVVDNYTLAQKYKKEVNNSYKNVLDYIKEQELSIYKIKDANEREEKRKEVIKNVDKKQNEYLELRKIREEEINKKIKLIADVIRTEKKLDIVIKKESAISGGVDITQDVINRLK